VESRETCTSTIYDITKTPYFTLLLCSLSNANLVRIKFLDFQSFLLFPESIFSRKHFSPKLHFSESHFPESRFPDSHFPSYVSPNLIASSHVSPNLISPSHVSPNRITELHFPLRVLESHFPVYFSPNLMNFVVQFLDWIRLPVSSRSNFEQLRFLSTFEQLRFLSNCVFQATAFFEQL
jgi:hypothetical protein